MRLYEYQLEAVKRLKSGMVLCGGVGSGKSITALSWYYILNGGEFDYLHGGEYIPMDDPPKPLYIITTARKRDTHEWDKELTNFLLAPGGNIYAMTPVVDSWNNIHKYEQVEGAVFIFDEQRLVGSGAWVKSFYKIAKKNTWILLSATPGDTWSDYIPLFVANGFYKNRTEFLKRHARYSPYVTKFPKIDGYVGEKHLRMLKDYIVLNMGYYKHTVSHDERIIAEYDSKLYKQLIRTRFDVWKEEPIENAGGLCYCLRRVVNEDVSRQKALLELAEDHKKMIVFYNFDYELDILRRLEYPPGTAVAEWNGHKHEQIPDSVRWVYLVHYAAGAEGWNCVETDTIVFYSQNYSYKTMVQAAGRIDRLNTPFTDLYYYHITSASSIDAAITRALRNKKNFNENKFVNW